MFAWTYLDVAGEDWIGSSWPQLLENGVLAVILVDKENGEQLYRMGLGAG